MSKLEPSVVARLSKVARGLAAPVVLVVAATTMVEAGSVFMKNGYILQGQIVDRDDDSIILGWPNGTVTIARRFVSTIVFDAVEENQLQELELTRRELAGDTTDAAQLFTEGQGETRDLPATLEGFMRTFNLSSSTTPTTELAVVEVPTETAVVTVVETNTVVEPTVTAVEPVATVDAVPAARLDDASFHAERLGVSLRPPFDWVPMVLENAVHVQGPQNDDGFSPSLSVMAFEVGALSPAEYQDLLKSEQQLRLEAYHLVEERASSLGGQECTELVASGLYAGREAIVRQGLVVRDGKVWLFSGMTSDRDADGAFGLIGESLETLEFDAVEEQ